MNRKPAYYYASLHFFYWMTNSAVLSFSSAFLLPQGFSSSEIGLLMCLGSVGALLLEPVLADYSDRSRHSLSAILEVLCGIFLILTGMLLILRGKSIALFVFYMLVYVVHTVMQPLLNEMNYRMERAGHAMNFGAARAMGSLGYSVMSAVMGILTEKFGIYMIPGITLFVILILMALLYVLGKYSGADTPADRTREKAEASGKGLKEFALAHRRLMVLSIGGILLMYSSHACGGYLLQIIMHVGGNAKDMGIALALAAATEIPVMMLFSRMQKRLSSGALLRISAIGYLLKQTTLLLAGSFPMVLFSQLFQMMSFAIYLPAFVAYSHEHTPEEDAVKGQALMPLTSAGAGLLASLSGGVLIDRFGVPSFLWVCLIMAALGAVLVFRYTEVTK